MWATILSYGALIAAQPSGALGFSEGMRSLDTGAPYAQLSAQRCAGCHEPQASAWRKSRHRVAYTNPIFQAGFQREPQARCIRCHAPLKEQVREVAASRGAMRTATSSLAAEGINCAVCHVRGDAVLASSAEGTSPHRTVVSQALKSGALCASCHQFRFQERVEGRSVLTDVVVQNTFGEWREYRAEGGTQTCISCHMPGGAHRFLGSHDPELLARTLRVKLKRTQAGEVQLELSAQGAGHRVPTGDLFRHLTLEVRAPDGSFETIRWMGRKFETVEEPKTKKMVRRLASDTSLRPGERRLIPMKPGAQFRLRYHYTKEASRWSRVIHEGRVDR